MQTSEIRQRWLDYFTARGHELRPSVPLISPDPSILFTIAGMVPFIPYITGEEEAPWPRAVSVQKCLRTNDIDNVGHTTRHGTFFQMNGNFSFGDYFKEGAINYAFDLLTGSTDEGKYGLDGERLWVTIWDQDKEAYDILTRGVGLDKSHIVQLPREENFWDTGQPGPAGPCAEWHYDRGPQYGPEAEGGNVDPGGDRYLELWNLVFDQYMRGEGEGKDYPLLHELDQKCIDTGAGLERLAFVLQDKPNMYEIDEVLPVITQVEEMTGLRYKSDQQNDVRMRVVADHVRSSMMLIADGVRPGNDGRGYVLRRLIRRAVRSMRLLGVDKPTLPDLLPVSRDAMAPSYPELIQNWQTISDVAYSEEGAFRRTLDTGTTIFDLAAQKADSKIISGEAAFSLHDTYGFPIDLTLEMAAEKGLKVDREKFTSLMEEQRERARADNRAKKAGHVDATVYHKLASGIGGASEFTGYTQTGSEAVVSGILLNGEAVTAAQGPTEVEVILDRTPFYAESGGQLADNGVIRLSTGAVIDVVDVQSPIKGLAVHRGTLKEGTVALGDKAFAEIDERRRHAIAQAHTATHMVHKALHEIVSDQATQAGSENSPSRLRFDFRHGKALDTFQTNEIEALVNDKLSQDLEITDQTMDLESAKATGAMALFGEKYGKTVRVVSIGGDWSKELCVGTHVPSTGHIGRITLVGESSIGSGVRRIDALVGTGAYEFQASEHALVSQLSDLLRGRPDELPEKVSSLLDKLKEREKEISSLRAQMLAGSVQELLAKQHKIGEFTVVTSVIPDVGDSDALRSLATDIRAQLGEDSASIVALVGIAAGKPVLIVATNESARAAGAKAGALVRVGSKILGGGGGGRDDLAQGGGTKADAATDALAALESEIGRL